MGRYNIDHLHDVKHAQCVTIAFKILTGSIHLTLVTHFSIISMLSGSGFNTYDHIFALGALWLRVRLCRCTIIASWKLNPIKWRPHRGIPIYDAHRACKTNFKAGSFSKNILHAKVNLTSRVTPTRLISQALMKLSIFKAGSLSKDILHAWLSLTSRVTPTRLISQAPMPLHIMRE